MDGDDQDCDAVVVDFDGSDGGIDIHGTCFTTGERKSRDGKWLFITSSFFIAVKGRPDVDYIRQSQD
jgi:hypothetical protein